MAGKGRSVVKRKSLKQLSVEIREKQDELKTTEKSWSARISEHDKKSEKILFGFKRETADKVKASACERDRHLAKAIARRISLDDSAKAKYTAIVEDAANAMETEIVAASSEYEETKRLETEKFKVITTPVEEEYHRTVKRILQDAKTERWTLEDQRDGELNGLRIEIEKLEVELKERKQQREKDKET